MIVRYGRKRRWVPMERDGEDYYVVEERLYCAICNCYYWPHKSWVHEGCGRSGMRKRHALPS